MRKYFLGFIAISVLFLLATGCSKKLSKTTPIANTNSINVNQPVVEDDKYDHGCIGENGYSWCESKQKCLKISEEECGNKSNVAISINDCIGIPTEKKSTSFDLLKKGIKFGYVESTQGKKTRVIEVPKFSDQDINNIIKEIQPYIKAIKGYSYNSVEVIIRPIVDRQRIEIYVRANTGVSKVHECHNHILPTFMTYGLQDFCSFTRDDYAFYLSYEQKPDNSFVFSDFKYEEELTTDVPDQLTKCAMALLEQDKNYLDFKNKYKNISWGLVDWGYDVDNKINTDVIRAMVAADVDTNNDYHFEGFAIDPWNKTVKASEEQVESKNNWSY
jgi:hypothetical protein